MEQNKASRVQNKIESLMAHADEKFDGHAILEAQDTLKSTGNAANPNHLSPEQMATLVAGLEAKGLLPRTAVV